MLQNYKYITMYTRSVKGETFPSAGSSKSWIFDVGIGVKYSIEFKYTITATLDTSTAGKQVTFGVGLSNIANTTSYSSLATAQITASTGTTQKAIIIAGVDGSVGKYMKISVDSGASISTITNNTLEIYLTTY